MMRRRSSPKLDRPNYQQRNASVATSNPTFHETEWMIHKATANRHAAYERTQAIQKIALWKILPGLVLIIVPWILGRQSEARVRDKKLEIDQLLEINKSLVQELELTTSDIRSLQQEAESLERANENTFQELKKNGGEAIDLQNEHYLAVEVVEDTLIRRIDELQKFIQENSQKQVTKKYVPN